MDESVTKYGFPGGGATQPTGAMYVGSYIQDDIKFTPKLTVNDGLSRLPVSTIVPSRTKPALCGHANDGAMITGAIASSNRAVRFRLFVIITSIDHSFSSIKIIRNSAL